MCHDIFTAGQYEIKEQKGEWKWKVFINVNCNENDLNKEKCS